MTLSDESKQKCKMGTFEAKDLVDHLPALAPLVAEHGEAAVVDRCQIARARCGSGQQAIDGVLAFYRGETGVVARRAVAA